MRIGIVAGEASGDILGAGLMDAILRQYPHCRFEGVGGERMLALGFDSFFPMDRLSVMGLIEPLKRLPELLCMRKKICKYFIDNPPDLFVGIDSPDFNLGIEARLRAAGVITAHYVSPSVWAWRQKRILKIKKSVDLMLTLLPFEARFYREHGVPVEYVGHPLADQFPLVPDQAAARQALGIAEDATLVALLPGSRGGEVKMLGKAFLETAIWCLERQPDIQFLLPAANQARRQQIEAMLGTIRNRIAILGQNGSDTLRVLDGDSHLAMSAADAVLMASGTTTLEALLLKKPMVVAYRMAPLSYAIISRMVKTRYISLPNLLADNLLVPEILQKDVTADKLGPALLERLNSPGLIKQLTYEFEQIHKKLRCDANTQAAQALLALIERRKPV